MNIRKMETALGSSRKLIYPSESKVYEKLRKSIVTTKTLHKGHVLNEGDLTVKVAYPRGIDALHFYSVIGRILKGDVNADTSLFYENLI